MVSKSKISLIRSLEMKKFRDKHGIFVAEGGRLVSELMGVFECEWMLAKTSWMATQGNIPARELLVDEDDEIRKVSFLTTPQDVIALFRIPTYNISEVKPDKQLVLALDGIQNPGNMGTIVRIADWFGIENIVCSTDSADVFAPKTTQATMGSLARVRVHYTDLTDFIAQNSRLPVYGTFIDGSNIYEQTLERHGIIVMGNEGNGIRPALEAQINQRLRIPSYPADRATANSLNVAVATAVVCAEFRRKILG